MTVMTDTPPGPGDVETVVRPLLATIEPLTLSADRRINPDRWVLSPRYTNANPTMFSDRAEAVEWFDANAGTIRGSIRIAHETNRAELTWTLCEGLWGYLHIRKDWELWRTTHQIGLEAAQQCDAAAQARMLSSLGSLRTWTNDLDEADRLHQRARALWVSAGHVLGQASSLESLGIVALKRATPAAAREFFRDARVLFSDLGRERGVVLMERRIGESFRDTGDYLQSENHLRSALDWFQDAGDDYQVIRTSRSLALTLRGQRHHQAARDMLEEGRNRALRIGARTDADELDSLLATIKVC